jgi:hypothetical protein
VPEGNQAQSHAPEAGPRPAAANGRADTAQPTPQSDPGPQIATPATAAQNHHPGEVGHTATTELTGSGDAVIEVTRTNWLPAVVHISGNSASEYFAVRTLGTNNVLVMTMEPYDGIRPLDWGGDESTGFEIWATGPWRIEILPPSAIPTFTGTFNGNGNMVVHFTGTGSLVRDHRKQSTPTLRSSGPQRLRPIPPPRRHNTTPRRRMPDQPRTSDLRYPGHRTLDHHHQNNPRVPRRTGLLSSLTPCVAESHRTRQRDRIAGSLRRHRNRGPRVHRSRADGFAIQHSGEPRPSPAPG